MLPWLLSLSLCCRDSYDFVSNGKDLLLCFPFDSVALLRVWAACEGLLPRAAASAPSPPGAPRAGAVRMPASTIAQPGRHYTVFPASCVHVCMTASVRLCVHVSVHCVSACVHACVYVCA